MCIAYNRKIRHRIYRYFDIRIIAIAVMLLGISNLFSPAAAGNLRVGIFDFDPLCRAYGRDRAGGLFVDLLEVIAAREGWHIQYNPGTLTECMERLERGEIDLIPAAAYSKENEAPFYYTVETVISTWAQVYIYRDNSLQSMIHLDNRMVGVVRDDPYNRELRDIIKRFDIQPTFVEFGSSAEIFQALKDKLIEAGVADRLYGVRHEVSTGIKPTPVIFSPVELRFAASREGRRDIIDTLDYHLNHMKNSPGSSYYLLLDQILGEKKKGGIPVFIFWSLGAAVGLLLLFVSASFLLHRQVDAKTKELFQKNRDLQKEIQERVRIGEALVESKEKLAAEKERLAVTLGSIGDGVITTGKDGNILLMNRMAETLTGWKQEEAQGQKVTQVFRVKEEGTGRVPDDPVQQVIETGIMIDAAGDSILSDRDGNERIILSNCAPLLDRRQLLGAVLVFHDITEKRIMEQEIRKAMKLESLGILAAGIAHDFNNLLTIIMGNIGLAKRFIDTQNRAYKILEDAEKGASSATGLSRQLLTFARGNDPVKEAASIQEIIEDSARFALRGSAVRCDCHFDPGLFVVDVDKSQVSQVFRNLIINSEQAMPCGGLITIRARNLDNHDRHAAFLPTGKHIEILLQDQGVGIPQEHLEKIFDPFFTTKQKGTGLGLSVVYSIIKKHDGYIRVESQLGKGTVFHIYLPATVKNTAPVSSLQESILTGTGKILVMDDNETILEMVAAILEEFGYRVVLARDGQEAVSLYHSALQAGEGYDAVIMDLTIAGGMGGKEAVAGLKKIDPGVKAIISSGYANNPVVAHYRDYGFKGVINKPFQVPQLSQVLHEVINGSS